MKILIADDNASMRQMIRAVVKPLVKEIYECGDGCEAIEIYKRIKPDLILMDFNMPRIDGLTAIRQIIAFDKTAQILLVTQIDDNDLRQVAQKAGAKAVISKDNLLRLRSEITKNF